METRTAIATEADERFYSAPSTIPGANEGLFARVPLREGDRLLVIGVLVPANSISDRCTRYADAYKLRAGDRLLIPVGWGALVNHHHDANVEKVVENGEVWLRAVRPIGRDEEIFYRYSEYAQDRFGPMSSPESAAAADPLP